ncbi:glycosyl hydrolase family 85-domain-containing protein [Tirmania nivea]|nr:glycosyl hydrolase family 85-domain-containing protein [Tirmania nivea]
MADAPADTPDFIYFESVDQLASWHPSSASPIHISNTPLFPRAHISNPTPPPSTQQNAKPRPAASRDQPPSQTQCAIPQITPLLVCHDFKGGYLAHEAAQGIASSETVYTCEYLQYIDIFVYFSHKRVVVPPASWTNLMHKNGVKILGTFLVEHAPGPLELRKIFEAGEDGLDASFYADQLVSLAKTYGFDGWLLNFESSFPSGTFDLPIFQSWLDYLKDEMHRAVTGSQVIWYDALTIDNKVRYQNGITDANKLFFDVSDGIFTNYWWREHNIRSTADIAAALGRPRDVFSGVDVWGRGSLGGGGFNVGEALAPIQRHGLATALFAPGWTFEHLGQENFRENERKFWVGDSYRRSAGAGFGPIAQYSKLLACGTSDYFYTNFSRGFGKVWRVGGELKSSSPWVHLGVQSVLPNLTGESGQLIYWDLASEYSHSGSWSLSLAMRRQTADSPDQISICPLYKLVLTIRKGTALRIRYLLPHANNVEKLHETGVYIDVSPDGTPQTTLRKFLAFETRREGEWCDLTIHSLSHRLQLKGNFEGFKIVELGAYCRHMHCAEDHTLDHTETAVDQTQSTETKQPFLYLGEVLLSKYTPVLYSITSISTNISSSGRTRLSWKIAADIGNPPEEIATPFSKVTGPFAYFLVYFDGELQGVAHTLEFTLNKSLIGRLGDYSVEGVMWNGDIIASS